MNKFYNKKAFYFIMLIFIVWLAGSAYWYTCELKNLCQKNNLNYKNKKVQNYSEQKEPSLESYPQNNTVEVKQQIVKKQITCSPYLKKSIVYGRINNINEVAKLEEFLNTFEEENLKVDGRYLKEDQLAVKRFQEKYTKNIDNLGEKIKVVDGIVGRETLEKINLIYCIDKAKEYLNKNKNN